MSQQKRGSAADVHHARCALLHTTSPSDAPEPNFVDDGSGFLVRLTLRLGLESTLDDDSESLLLLETLIALVFLDDLLAAAKTCPNKSVEAQLMYITHAVQVQGQLLQNMLQQKRGSAADVHHAHFPKNCMRRSRSSTVL